MTAFVVLMVAADFSPSQSSSPGITVSKAQHHAAEVLCVTHCREGWALSGGDSGGDSGNDAGDAVMGAQSVTTHSLSLPPPCYSHSPPPHTHSPRVE